MPPSSPRSPPLCTATSRLGNALWHKELPSCQGARLGPPGQGSSERSPARPSAGLSCGPPGGAALSSGASKPPTRRAVRRWPERAVR
eukprot:8595285-Pyramimonas_sp.AAC.1